MAQLLPVDEFDLAENLKPAIARFRKERQQKAKSEALELYSKVG